MWNLTGIGWGMQMFKSPPTEKSHSGLGLELSGKPWSCNNYFERKDSYFFFFFFVK
jgi:hypothetical protein